ncbi:hypothetical protein [Pseudomonas matsuisoli]|uniref:Lipoprotein n=1 Tax=Pseudomonas matsuisoli TaxID=1515666 RepID=A0A917PX44_9PSED|nr:hypothetical protein [Pseudomonas matsuisoli]GGJ96201.1 hypothetical protein GCM10009304_22620 [Pseudomonas matsuisoli]
MKTTSLLILAALMLLLTGCSGYTASGYLQVQDAARLKALGGQAAELRPGQGSLEFGMKPLIFANDLALMVGHTTIEAEVPKAAYDGSTFLVQGAANALPFDMSVAWTERHGEQITRDERVECRGPGYCEGPVSRTYCSPDGSGRQNCRSETRYEYGYFSNCPGTMPVRNRYQIYRYGVTANLLVPNSTMDVLATFKGQTTANERLLATEREGMCQSRL